MSRAKEKETWFSKQFWPGIIVTVVGGLLLWVIQLFLIRVVPQFNFTVDLASLVPLVAVAYIVLSNEKVSCEIDKVNFISSSIIVRVVGGLFWVATGLLFITNQMGGKTDPTLNPYVTYAVGAFFAVCGGFQIIGIYEVVKNRIRSAVNILVSGEDYEVETVWETLIYDISSEDDEKYKNELIQKAVNKIENMRKRGYLSAVQYKKFSTLIEKSKCMSFTEFNERYLSDPNREIQKDNPDRKA
jgi:hypothetical protein